MKQTFLVVYFILISLSSNFVYAEDKIVFVDSSRIINTSLAGQSITEQLKIPTIGIGSSKNCDGQILVTDDMLGLSGFYPKFVKKYANLNRIIEKAVKKYTREVKLRKFPTRKNFLNGTKFRK